MFEPYLFPRCGDLIPSICAHNDREVFEDSQAISPSFLDNKEQNNTYCGKNTVHVLLYWQRLYEDPELRNFALERLLLCAPELKTSGLEDA